MNEFCIYWQGGGRANTVPSPCEPSNSDWQLDGLDVQTGNNAEHMLTTVIQKYHIKTEKHYEIVSIISSTMGWWGWLTWNRVAGLRLRRRTCRSACLFGVVPMSVAVRMVCHIHDRGNSSVSSRCRRHIGSIVHPDYSCLDRIDLW